MKKLPLFSKRAALRIVIVVGLLGLLYSLFIHFPAPVLSMWWNVYFVNLVWNADQKPEIWKIGSNLKDPKFVTIEENPNHILPFLKDDFNIYSIMNCPWIPATGFDAASFEGIDVWTGWFIVKDKNGTYISHRDGKYGRPEGNCSNDRYAPYKKISE